MVHSGLADVFTAAQASSGESTPLCSELRDESNRLVWSAREPWLGSAGAKLRLEGGRRYELKVSDCFPASKPNLYQTTLIATHP
jgi:hypothetical protein